MKAYLELSAAEGRRHVELVGEQVTLGRSPDNEIAFPTDETVSRQHAVVKRSTDGWWLRDLGSANGTHVNGERLQGEHLLGSGDVLTLGAQELVFRPGAESRPHDSAMPDRRRPEAQVGSAEAAYLDAGEEWSGSPETAAAPPSGGVPDPPRESVALPRSSTPAPAVPAAPEARHGHAQVTGVARNVQLRATAGSSTGAETLFFRIDQYDRTGNRLPAVAVQFGPVRDGNLAEGEDVQASGTFKHGTLRAKRVHNLSTGAELRGPGGGQAVAFGCFFVVVIGFIATILIILIISIIKG